MVSHDVHSQGISVIIPAYNSGRYLSEAIQSVFDQNYDDVEIVISDDGSRDDTLSIAESFGEKVILLKKPSGCTTQGVSSTRNRGIKAATKPFIAFLDSDDFYLPGHLKKMMEALIKNPQSGFCFCRMLEVKDENGNRSFRPWTRLRIFENDIKNCVASRGYIVHTNSFLFRKEVFDEAGYFDESYSNAEDSDLWMRINEKFPATFCDHYGAAYRISHGENQLTNNPQQKIIDCHIKVSQSAIRRYYQMEKKDLNRIFDLKHTVLHNQYHENKLLYFFKYFFLVFRYPTVFLQKIPVIFAERKERKEWRKWKSLDQFINE